MCLIREKSSVNASEDNPGAASASLSPDFVASECVARVQPDANDIASLNGCHIDGFKRFIDD
jgi:hypothetical protein